MATESVQASATIRQWFRMKMMTWWQRNNPPIVSRGQNAAINLPMIQQQRHQQTNKSIRKEYFNDNTKNEQSVSAIDIYGRVEGNETEILFVLFSNWSKSPTSSQSHNISSHLSSMYYRTSYHSYSYNRWRCSLASSRSRIRTSLTAVASNSSRSTSEAPNSNFYCSGLGNQDDDGT